MSNTKRFVEIHPVRLQSLRSFENKYAAWVDCAGPNHLNLLRNLGAYCNQGRCPISCQDPLFLATFIWYHVGSLIGYFVKRNGVSWLLMYQLEIFHKPYSTSAASLVVDLNVWPYEWISGLMIGFVIIAQTQQDVAMFVFIACLDEKCNPLLDLCLRSKFRIPNVQNVNTPSTVNDRLHVNLMSSLWQLLALLCDNPFVYHWYVLWVFILSLWVGLDGFKEPKVMVCALVPP